MRAKKLGQRIGSTSYQRFDDSLASTIHLSSVLEKVRIPIVDGVVVKGRRTLDLSTSWAVHSVIRLPTGVELCQLKFML